MDCTNHKFRVKTSLLLLPGVLLSFLVFGQPQTRVTFVGRFMGGSPQFFDQTNGWNLTRGGRLAVTTDGRPDSRTPSEGWAPGTSEVRAFVFASRLEAVVNVTPRHLGTSVLPMETCIGPLTGSHLDEAGAARSPVMTGT